MSLRRAWQAWCRSTRNPFCEEHELPRTHDSFGCAHLHQQERYP